MITVAAIRMEQFGVQFYQASLTARDVGKLVRFEVLSYGEKTQPLRGAGKGTSKVNWDLLERRIAANEKSYQRQIIGKKIEELVQYYEQCREARNLPSIPGAVIIASEEPLKFEPRATSGTTSACSRCPSARASCVPSTGSTGCSRSTTTSSASATTCSTCRR